MQKQAIDVTRPDFQRRFGGVSRLYSAAGLAKLQAAQFLLQLKQLEQQIIVAVDNAVGHVRTNLNTVEDGEEALSFLHRQGRFKYAPRPHLIILDLKLWCKSTIKSNFSAFSSFVRAFRSSSRR